MGLIALVLAVVGFFLACSRALFFVGFAYPAIGFVLLAVALILGVIAACLRGRAKWAAIAAIIISAVGVVVGVALSVFVAALSSGVGYY